MRTVINWSVFGVFGLLIIGFIVAGFLVSPTQGPTTAIP